MKTRTICRGPAACGLFAYSCHQGWLKPGNKIGLVSMSVFEELGTDAGYGEKAEGTVGHDREAGSVHSWGTKEDN